MNKIQRILFIDDDVIIGLVTKRLLEHMQAAEDIRVFSDSRQALMYMKDLFQPQAAAQTAATGTLVFLDIDMPGNGGFEVLSILKTLASTGGLVLENCFFVIVTSHLGDREIKRAKEADVLEILEKPLRQEDIHALFEKIQHRQVILQASR